jgi:transglutaminase-like putative cysteine protease
MTRKYFLLFFTFITFNTFYGAITYAPASSWVKSLALPEKRDIQVNDINNGYYYILEDEQLNIATKQYYYHYAYKIVSEAGVQNASELSFSYNPAYEKFTLHQIKVLRNGKYIDKLKSSTIKEIQREAGFEEHLYNESMSVIAVLKDIKAGDIIEYDYTSTGENPIFKGAFYYHFYFSYDYEILHASLRILKPFNRKLNFKVQNVSITPSTSIIGDLEEIIYEVKNQKGFKIEKYLPYSYNPYYSIEISEYENWQQVNQWAKKVFFIADANSSKLNSKIEDIKKESSDKEKQIISALRFVQDKIRYMGVEIGVNSHQPASPNKVLEQGYGDCKDKSTLLCKILEGLNIKAYPALVNSSYRDGVQNNLVSPKLFNHCIVKVVNESKTFWFDPTASYQSGDINHYYTPNYKIGFVVGGEANNLEPITKHQYSSVNIHENYLIKDFSGYGELIVKSIYSGAEADNMRNYLANTGTTDMQKYYTDFYKKHFPEISPINNFEVEDDKINNKVTQTEHYKISNFWKFPDTTDKNSFQSNLYALSINEKINIYDAEFSNRTMPIYLDYPTHIIESITVDLPEDWNVDKVEKVISNDFMKFTYKKSNVKNKVSMYFEYEALTNEIPADKSKAHINTIDQIVDDYLSFSLTYNKNGDKASEISSFTINWLMVMLFIMALGIFSYIAFNNYKKQNVFLFNDNNEFQNSTPPLTIGGWLVLPLLGLLFTPLIIIYRLFSDDSYFNQTVWNKVTMPGGEGYHQLFAPILIFEVISYALIFVFCILLLFMMLNNKRSFPKYIITFYILNVVILIISVAGANHITNELNLGAASQGYEVFKSFIQGAIWIPYFLISERVKETFTK